jgi:hypothetical protein
VFGLFCNWCAVPCLACLYALDHHWTWFLLLLLLLLLFPGQPLPPDACEVHVAPCLARFAWSSLRGQHYQAVLINTGWEVRQQQQQQEDARLQQQQHSVDADIRHEPHAAAGQTRGVPSWEQHSAPELPGSSSGSGKSGSSSSAMTGLASVVQRLALLPIPQLCPRGFVMIWANKEHLAGAL